jgi:hypothetical protein
MRLPKGSAHPEIVHVGQITDLLSALVVKPHLQKYSAFQKFRIILYPPSSRPTKRGVS